MWAIRASSCSAPPSLCLGPSLPTCLSRLIGKAAPPSPSHEWRRPRPCAAAVAPIRRQPSPACPAISSRRDRQMQRRRFLIAVAMAAFLPIGAANAVEHAVPKSSFGRLDHVFLVIMENQTDTDVLGNPSAPFINAYARQANRASNYVAVGHPSAPNYLEIVGGSNF